MRLIKRSTLPPRDQASFVQAVRERHAAILGICALVDSYPYSIPEWMPELVTEVLAEHTFDPVSRTLPSRSHRVSESRYRSRFPPQYANARATSSAHIKTHGLNPLASSLRSNSQNYRRCSQDRLTTRNLTGGVVLQKLTLILVSIIRVHPYSYPCRLTCISNLYLLLLHIAIVRNCIIIASFILRVEEYLCITRDCHILTVTGERRRRKSIKHAALVSGRSPVVAKAVQAMKAS